MESAMSLVLWYHPLSSYCWKALIALYEGDIAFAPKVVSRADPPSEAAFRALWPLGKFPVLQDEATGAVVGESSTIVRWLARRYASAAPLFPQDDELAWQVDLRDRVLDNYVHNPMQRINAGWMRPDDQRDELGAGYDRDQIRATLDYLEPLTGDGWAVGADFTLADAAALPALHYAARMVPLEPWPKVTAYLGRLKARPSVVRVLKEAEPFFHLLPKEPA
jgi:glutathione S-transferase